jgi:transposase
MYVKKLLERGIFERPAVAGNAVTSGQLSLLLQGKADFGALQKAL